MTKNWVLKSDLDSVKNTKVSILAVIETIIAISLSIFIWYHYDSFIHILIGLIIALFLLLRTEKSTKEALKLFHNFDDKYFRKYVDINDKFILFFLNSIFFSILGIFLIENNGFLIVFSITLIIYIFLYLTKKYFSTHTVIVRVFVIKVIVSISLFTIMILTVAISVIIKIFSTIQNFSVNSIKNIPSNWKKQVLFIDSFYPPELLPDIEQTNSEFKFTTFIKKDLMLQEGLLRKIIAVLMGIILFLPAMIYRYSLKATALVYLPIIWLISTPKNENLTKKMETESKIFTAYMMFFYSLVVVFIFTFLPFYLHIHAQSISPLLPSFIPSDFYHIFFAIEFNLWHLTRLISAIITIIFFFTFHRVLKLREGDPNYGEHFGAKLLQLTTIRTLCTAFTLLVTVYLIYKAIPKEMIDSIWENMKFLPT